MKGIDYVIKKTAQEQGIPEKEVRQLITAYWDDMYEKLITGDATTLAVRNVGVFTASMYKLNVFIHHMITRIRYLRKNPEKYASPRYSFTLDNHLNRLRKALKRRNELAIQYYKQQEKTRKLKNELNKNTKGISGNS